MKIQISFKFDDTASWVIPVVLTECHGYITKRVIKMLTKEKVFKVKLCLLMNDEPHSDSSVASFYKSVAYCYDEIQ